MEPQWKIALESQGRYLVDSDGCAAVEFSRELGYRQLTDARLRIAAIGRGEAVDAQPGWEARGNRLWRNRQYICEVLLFPMARAEALAAAVAREST